MRMLLIAALLVPLSTELASQERPATAVREVTDVIHETPIVDPYRWLEDQDSPETRAWIDQQTRYARSVLDPLPQREELKARLADVVRTAQTGWPRFEGGRYFYTRREAAEQLPSYYVRHGLDGAERRILDPAAFSKDYSKNVSVFDVSPDGRLVAYGVRDGGADETDIRVRDVDTGRDLPDHLPSGAHYAVILLPEGRGLVYTLRTAAGSRVYEHRMGADPSTDVLLFGDGYPDSVLIWLNASDDRRLFMATVSQGAGNNAPHDLFLADRSKGPEFRPLVTGLGAPLWSTWAGHRLFVRTNWKAPRWRVLEIDLAASAPEHWREVIPQGDSPIESLSAAGGKLVVSVLENVTSRLRLYEAGGAFVREIPLPTLGSAYAGGRWDRDELFFGFESFTTPWGIYRYVPSTGQRSVWFELRIERFDPKAFETRQVWFASKDGTRVPMFVVSQRGATLDGDRPTLLTAYGGYGASATPYLEPMASIIAERGGVFALANIRGGGEFGEEWHRAGMLDRKQNSFDDFLAAAEWLMANKYTRPERLAIEGGSNGGLLVGAALTQRPDLFRAVVCQFPHLDMIRYQKFLRAAPWVAEYGDPDDPAAFKYLYAYSPYHHVRPGVRYPATLFVTGDHDTRVAPLHARKMTARLQAVTTGSDRPIVLRYDTVLGHSWGASVDRELDYRTDVLAFILSQVGSGPQKTRPTASLR